jgi:hypothetical protein
MTKPLKLWLVKRKVLATSLQQALRAKGRVYSVDEAAKEFQPEDKPKKKVGFTK